MTSISSRPPSPPHRPERLLAMALPLLLLVAGCPQPAAVPASKPAATPKPVAQQDRPPYPVVQDPETNGYHELLLAAALVREAPGLDTSPSPDQPLDEVRKIAEGPQADEIVSLVRRALKKPVDYPVAEPDLATPFPELADFRRISRLLAHRYRVQSSEKDWNEAAGTFRTGLDLARAMPDEFIIGTLVQTALLNIVVSAPARQMEHLDEAHCRELIQFCGDCPLDKAIVRKAMNGDIDLVLRSLARPAELLGVPRWEAFLRYPLFKEAAGRLEAKRQEFVGLVDQPVNERRPIRSPPGLTSEAVESLLALGPQVATTYETKVAAHRLLQTHLWLRLHYLEHGSHPASLAELKAGELIIDPLAEKPFRYARKGKSYSLTSIGPPLSPDEELEGKKRRPIDLTRGRSSAKDAR